jgi:hypothetical protein
MIKITLVLDRVHNDLWLDVNCRHTSCIWGVTGLKRDTESLFGHVKILRSGKQIGGCWNVVEIKETWK